MTKEQIINYLKQRIDSIKKTCKFYEEQYIQKMKNCDLDMSIKYHNWYLSQNDKLLEFENIIKDITKDENEEN